MIGFGKKKVMPDAAAFSTTGNLIFASVFEEYNDKNIFQT
jgi:hypothetical protein